MAHQDILVIPESLCFTGGDLAVTFGKSSSVTYKGVEVPVMRMIIDINWDKGMPPIVTMTVMERRADA